MPRKDKWLEHLDSGDGFSERTKSKERTYTGVRIEGFKSHAAQAARNLVSTDKKTQTLTSLAQLESVKADFTQSGHRFFLFWASPFQLGDTSLSLFDAKEILTKVEKADRLKTQPATTPALTPDDENSNE